MLAKAPADRYQLMHELRTDLASVREADARSEPAATRAVALPPRGRSPAPAAAPQLLRGMGHRRSVQIGLAAVVLTAIVTASLWPRTGPGANAALSVVVLPPDNVSGTADDDYLANGNRAGGHHQTPWSRVARDPLEYSQSVPRRR